MLKDFLLQTILFPVLRRVKIRCYITCVDFCSRIQFSHRRRCLQRIHADPRNMIMSLASPNFRKKKAVGHVDIKSVGKVNVVSMPQIFRLSMPWPFNHARGGYHDEILLPPLYKKVSSTAFAGWPISQLHVLAWIVSKHNRNMAKVLDNPQMLSVSATFFFLAG